MQPIDTTPIDTHIERLGPMAAANLRATAVDPFEAFVAPGDVFRHPREVLSYPGLSRAEKRAILASWASDARAVDSCPTLRCLPGCRAEPVPIDDVLAALQALDGTPAPSGQATVKPRIPVVLGRRLRRGPAAREAVLN
ncbi:hypothetical protein [Methylobacterium sp. ARG-1]|uniref:hypothetical protein n=1 Tax=Methylobacterium sp. ARG-1 TaxID=1692501 RepID=UPI0006824AF5|nr:hypothetical protein [Methylobacterium sp. ARG-1]KNY19489.1 hypothetical protein AKJ13_27430 [Methylobacterium sp. ARG-1]